MNSQAVLSVFICAICADDKIKLKNFYGLLRLLQLPRSCTNLHSHNIITLAAISVGFINF